jgi:multiple antibiotic resistance protein
LLEYIFLAITSLFVIIDPIATVPAFFAMTPNDSTEDRIRTARLATMVAFGVLVSFVFAGQAIFRLLGITMSAFKIAGSIVLLLIALDMLRARRSAVQETREEQAEGAVKEDVAITPLGIPMLAGPGAISTVVLLQAQAKSWEYSVALVGCILGVCYVTYLILSFAARHGSRFIGPIAMRITTRIMGLLLAALAIQFILDAVSEQRMNLFYRPEAVGANSVLKSESAQAK